MGGMFPFPFSPSAPAAPQGGWVSQAFNANPNPFPNMVSGGPFYMDTGSALAGGLGGGGIPEALPSAMGFGSNVGASAGLAGMGGAGASAGGESLAAGLASGAGSVLPEALSFGSKLKATGPYWAGGVLAGALGHYLDTNAGDKGVMGGIGRFMEGAGPGAALGATVGSFVPVIGTGIGALAGGALGGAYDLFAGGNGDAKSKAQSALDQANLAYHSALGRLATIDPQTADIIHQQMSTMYGFASTPEAKIKILQDSAGTIAANLGTSRLRSGAYSNATQLLNAVQTYQGQHVDSSAAKYNADEAARAAYMNQLVGQMKPAQQAYGHYMVSQQLEQAAQALQSQQAQAQALPYMLALQMQNQIGQQYAPYGITPQMTPASASTSSGTSSNGIDLASILAQSQQPATTGP